MNASISSIKAPPPPARSTLVSVLGWIAIVGGALGMLSAIAQLTFFGTLSKAPIPDMDPALQESLFRSLQGVTVLNLALAGFLAYAGYALWKRRNWARRTFIVLFALGIAANVIWVVVTAIFGSLFGQFGASLAAIWVVLAICALGVVVLFAWLIKRLRSAALKSEFV